MGLRVLIVPDKFKGTLTARQAAEAIARGWRRGRPGDELELLPMSDGGDGFGEVLSALLGAGAQAVRTCDAAHRPGRARWWWHAKSKTALIETAQVIGLAMLPAGRFHPFQLDTFGLGKVLRAALGKRPRRILVGLGGSGTNDGGFGLARALGWEFLNGAGQALEQWINLGSARRVKVPGELVCLPEMVVAVDVQNPLLGPRGASRVYGPQKGLTPADFPAAERCLRRLALLMRQNRGRDFSRLAGAGAAGGLGFGFAAFLQGRLEPGFELFAREAGLDKRLRGVDLVVTGEGALDRSTFMGKGAGQIAARCRARGIPCVALLGTIHPRGLGNRLFAEMRALTDVTTLRRAKSGAAEWLERVAWQTACHWPAGDAAQPRKTRKVGSPLLNSGERGVRSGP